MFPVWGRLWLPPSATPFFGPSPSLFWECVDHGHDSDRGEGCVDHLRWALSFEDQHAPRLRHALVMFLCTILVRVGATLRACPMRRLLRIGVCWCISRLITDHHQSYPAVSASATHASAAALLSGKVPISHCSPSPKYLTERAYQVLLDTACGS